MKKVLVSGAGGFVGARIMTQLADRYELCSFPKGMARRSKRNSSTGAYLPNTARCDLAYSGDFGHRLQ